VDLVTWEIGRIAGLASYAALCISIVSGLALRTSVLDFLAKNRALRALHDWTLWLWIPLGAAHVATLLLDHTARLELIDVVVPFQTDYGQLAIGLGTISLDLFVIVVVTSWLRRRMNNRLWTWIHRTSYIAFLALFLHAYLGGTDFDSPIVSAISWSAASGLALLAVSRIFFGRLAE
jgi:DMSO/TMAO reductase YedYZ heme-binding membrane subunit